MLKANELRIGNLVQSCNDIISVEYVDKLLLKGVFHRDIIYNTSLQVKHCKPIELNEEWLIKLGFEWENHGLRKGNLCIRQYGGGWSIFMSNESFNFNIELKYVHQFQNLHFALTGVELELSSNVA